MRVSEELLWTTNVFLRAFILPMDILWELLPIEEVGGIIGLVSEQELICFGANAGGSMMAVNQQTSIENWEGCQKTNERVTQLSEEAAAGQSLDQLEEVNQKGPRTMDGQMGGS